MLLTLGNLDKLTISCTVSVVLFFFSRTIPLRTIPNILVFLALFGTGIKMVVYFSQAYKFRPFYCVNFFFFQLTNSIHWEGKMVKWHKLECQGGGGGFG